MVENTLLNAIKDYKIKNYRDAFLAFKKLSKSVTEAQYYLGMMYYYGQGVTRDYTLAYRYIKMAWAGLYPEAIYMLGVMSEFGHGTEKDLNQAFEYYHASSKNESINGLLKVAKFYEQGIVVERNLTKAIKIYVELTNLKNAYAMYKIGVFYLEGVGLKKSMENAYNWLNKALAQGSVEAMNYFRYIGAKSKTDIRSSSEIYKTALSYINKGNYADSIILLNIAANEGNLEAIKKLSQAYMLGEGVDLSLENAFKTLLKYKDLNHPELDYLIAKKYELGEGVPSSYIKAVLFYESSAKKEYTLSINALKEIRGY